MFFTLCLCASTLSAFAQGGTVTGVVTDETGATMPGVNVMVRGTTIGVVTDADGKFSINAASTDVLQVSFVGYTTQEITVGEQTSVNVSLAEGAQQIDEVVVTALGIKRDKKALGYATQEISADKLLETRTSSVANALIGKVAGAQITESGMGMGGSTRIVIRGASSLSGQNQPLWVVDGIPIDDSQPVDVVMENDWSARDRAGMASQINPDDIESISILKGPSASALYGIRAGSGVVLVTTKKGAAGKWTVNWNSNYTVEKIASLPNLQNKYGQGTGGIYDVQSELSWGPEMTGQKLLNFRGQSVDFLPQSNREKDFFKTGSGFTNTVSVSGGNDVASVRLSFNDSRNKGVMPEHSLNRQGVDLHGSVKLGKRLVISGKANYIAENVQNPLETGQYSPMNQLMLMPRSVRLQDLTPSREAGKHVNWKPDDSFHINPMFSPEWNNYSNKTSRLLGYVSADLEITRTLSLSAKSGLDYYGLDEASKEYPWEAKGSRVYAVREGYVQENNSDILLKFNNRYGKFDIGLNVGASYMHRKLDNVKVTAPFQNGDSFFSVGNGSSLTVAEQLSERSTNSVYGMANFAYNDYLYLDFTARNDWASTLPKNSWSFFYPSV
ncbi:MAG: SusC/RagA family TonB-linked outer membrane protein, partial [Bacteroidales bacterium]|nr:SusC/RagA family TonB-linked outer membrane protein [Bacteroidales bacterium]